MRKTVMPYFGEITVKQAVEQVVSYLNKHVPDGRCCVSETVAKEFEKSQHFISGCEYQIAVEQVVINDPLDEHNISYFAYAVVPKQKPWEMIIKIG